MGKKTIKEKLKEKHSDKYKNLPFVSICTPTYNRRPFIESMIKCFEHQDYPKDRIEWIIVDDGIDKIEDLVTHIPQVKYFKYDTKMPLGEKRNLMHSKCVGDIYVYMDDDDYYPPERISHAVETLLANPQALCAGSSEIYIYFKHIEKMYQFGPYGPNHATAGTFAFKKELLENTKYDNTACLAEEKQFLKEYTVPFVQLNPLKTILVFSHIHNTFDKKVLLNNPNPKFVKESDKTVDMFVNNLELKEFFMNKLENLLDNYDPGHPKYKPDVLKQLDEITKSREKDAKEHEKRFLNTTINLSTQNGTSQQMTIQEILELLSKNANEMNQMNNAINIMKTEINNKDRELMELRIKTNTYNTVVDCKNKEIERLTDILKTIGKNINEDTISSQEIHFVN